MDGSIYSIIYNYKYKLVYVIVMDDECRESKHKYSTWVLLGILGLVSLTVLVSGIEGIGTPNYIAKFLGNDLIGNSSIYDDGNGSVIIYGNLTVNNLYVNNQAFIKTPYLYAIDNTTQVATIPNTPYIANFSTLKDNYNINLVDKQNFTFNESGDYTIAIIATVQTTTANKHVEMWLQKNGVNIPDTNRLIEYVTPNVENSLPRVLTIDLNANDSIRVMWASDDSGQLVYMANTSYSPASPSISINIHKVGEITP